MSIRPKPFDLVLPILLWGAFLLGGMKPAFLKAQPVEAPWEKAPFTGDGKALLEAAQQVKAAEGEGATVLFEEAHYSLDSKGRCDTVTHMVYRIETAGAVEGWSTLQALWEPWHLERPQMRARVITSDGVEHALDASTIGEFADKQSEGDLFDDRKFLRAPLPAVAPGAIVETEVVTHESTPVFDRGVVKYFYVGAGVTTDRTRLVLDAPSSLPLRYVTRLLQPAQPEKKEENGSVRLEFNFGRQEAIEHEGLIAPSDIAQVPYLAFATGKSWAEVAGHLAEVLEEKIDVESVRKIAQEATRGAKTREEIAAGLMAYVRKEVRYTGIEFGESSLIPRPPAETLKRKYGDCKDQSTLMVAMLRALKIPAHVVALDTGPGLDVETSLPGIGIFDHSIVYVPGAPPLWIDPTANLTRIGQLPIQDQGRLALVASPETRELIPTPVSTSADNVSIETREVFLPEEGNSRVVETTEVRGSFELSYRGGYRNNTRKDIEEMLTKYTKSILSADALSNFQYTDSEDFSSPFRVTLEVKGSKLGVSGGGRSEVAIYPGNLPNDLPDWFTISDEEKERRKRSAKSGKKAPDTDVVIPNSFIKEVRYKISLPPGFTAEKLPEAEEKHFGPATFSRKFEMASDGMVLATIRFDSGKSRITRPGAEELRKGVQELRKADAVTVEFVSVGELDLEASKIREALAEFRRLAELHPKEALHRGQVARALLAAGLEEQARLESKRAVELEPASTEAYRTRGFILIHDLIGRQFRKGFDQDGAVAAYRKALELDSSDTVSRINLALALEHSLDGTHHGSGAKLDEAIQTYRSFPEEISSSSTYFLNLPLDLMFTGKMDELNEFLKKHEGEPRLNQFRLVAKSLKESPDAAVKEAARTIPEENARQSALNGAASLLISLRRYPEASTLLTAAARGASDSPQLLARADVMRRARRHEDIPFSKDDPAAVPMKHLAALFLSDDTKSFVSLFVKDVREEIAKESELDTLSKVKRGIMAMARGQGIQPETIVDLTLGSIQTAKEGNDHSGYRVRLRTLGGETGTDMVWFVRREEGEYRAFAASPDWSKVGAEALRLLGEGEVGGARQLLHWARGALPLGGGDDPFAGSVFARFWTKGSNPGVEEIRYAAAALNASSKNCAKAIPILEEGRAKAVSEEDQQKFDLALAGAYELTKKYDEAAIKSELLLKLKPESKTAFFLYTGAMGGLKRWNEIQSQAEARLRRVPEDTAAPRILSSVGAHQGDFKKAQDYLNQLITAGRGEAGDYNNWAWFAIFQPSDLNPAIDAAHRACALT